MNLSEPAVYLSLLVFLPAVAGLGMAILPVRFTDDAYKFLTLAVTIVTFMLLHVRSPLSSFF